MQLIIVWIACGCVATILDLWALWSDPDDFPDVVVDTIARRPVFWILWSFAIGSFAGPIKLGSVLVYLFSKED